MLRKIPDNFSICQMTEKKNLKQFGKPAIQTASFFLGQGSENCRTGYRHCGPKV